MLRLPRMRIISLSVQRAIVESLSPAGHSLANSNANSSRSAGGGSSDRELTLVRSCHTQAMTSISQYLRAERLDTSEPASFYIPGAADWDELRSPRGMSKLAARTRAPAEQVYPTEDEDGVPVEH